MGSSGLREPARVLLRSQGRITMSHGGSGCPTLASMPRDSVCDGDVRRHRKGQLVSIAVSSDDGFNLIGDCLDEGGTRRGIQPGERRYRSEEHTSELQSLMHISYAVF